MKPTIDGLCGETYLTAMGASRGGRTPAASPIAKHQGIRRAIAGTWSAFIAALVQAEYRFPPDYYLGP